MGRELIYEIDCGEEDPFIVSYDVYDLADEFGLDITAAILNDCVIVTFEYGVTVEEAKEMLDELRMDYARVD